MHLFRDIIDTLHNTSVEIVETKKKALAGGDEELKDQIAKGKDIMSILCKLILLLDLFSQVHLESI